MKFFYRARNKDGIIKSGLVVAASQNRAEELLAENDLVIVSIESRQDDLFEKMNPFGRSVSTKELVLFSRQLATMISARVPIIQSLRILEDQIDNKYLLGVITDIIAAVQNGESLSFAMSKYEKVFNNVYTSLVKSGEVAGSLDKSLVYLADQQEKDYELKRKVKGAMTYPMFVLGTLTVVMVLMFKFILPKLTSVLEEQGGNLPYISQLLISFTHFFDKFWWVVIIGLGVFVLIIKYLLSTTVGRENWDYIKLKLPIFGGILQKIYLTRFSRNLATLVKGGIPIIKALQIVSEIIGNTVYRDILLDTISKISGGKAISDGLSGHEQEFPSIVTQMVKVGEQTAQLDDILSKLSLFYEKEVDSKISTLTTLMEPLIMIVLGIGVGILVAGILMPIYNLASSVG